MASRSDQLHSHQFAPQRVIGHSHCAIRTPLASPTAGARRRDARRRDGGRSRPGGRRRLRAAAAHRGRHLARRAGRHHRGGDRRPLRAPRGRPAPGAELLLGAADPGATAASAVQRAAGRPRHGPARRGAGHRRARPTCCRRRPTSSPAAWTPVFATGGRARHPAGPSRCWVRGGRDGPRLRWPNGRCWPRTAKVDCISSGTGAGSPRRPNRCWRRVRLGWSGATPVAWRTPC